MESRPKIQKGVAEIVVEATVGVFCLVRGL
jgi:hypothetical protein